MQDNADKVAYEYIIIRKPNGEIETIVPFAKTGIVYDQPTCQHKSWIDALFPNIHIYRTPKEKLQETQADIEPEDVDLYEFEKILNGG